MSATELDFVRCGPATLGGRLLRSFWQPIALARSVPVGVAKPVTVLDGEFTLYRGASGATHLLPGRCAHRNALLSLGTIEGETIQCFYHGWKYDADGQCVFQAIERPGFAESVKLPSWPTHEYLGLIFAYFGPGAPPPPPRYPEFEQGVVVDAAEGYYPFNFFQNMENSVDTLHVAYVHRLSSFFGAGDDGKPAGNAEKLEGEVLEVNGEETAYGFVCRTQFDTGGVRVNHFEMPNIIHIQVPPLGDSGWRDFVAWKVPIDDGSYRNFNLTVARVEAEAAERYRAHPRSPSQTPDTVRRDRQRKLQEVGDRIIRGESRLDVDDIGELATSVELQDYIVQKGQGTIVDRSSERLGRSDRLIAILRRLWKRELDKIESGAALTAWRWPSGIVSSSGALR